MNHTTKKRDIEATVYPSGTTRFRLWACNKDIRLYRPPKGWTAHADVLDVHPITGRPLPYSRWWIIETKE